MFDFLRGKKKKSVLRYDIRERSKGVRRYKTILALEPHEFLDEDDFFERFSDETTKDGEPFLEPGATYKCICIYNDNSKKTIWTELFGIDEKVVGKDKAPLLRVNKNRLSEIRDDIASLAELSQVMAELGSAIQIGGDKQKGGDLPAPEFEGKLPMYLHPAAASSITEFTKDVVSGIKEGFTGDKTNTNQVTEEHRETSPVKLNNRKASEMLDDVLGGK